MSHRAYLYNISTPSVAQEKDKMMMEWGYEMPLLLQPLLIKGGFIAENNYNNHVEHNNAGLFFEAPAGIENLKHFYDFLDKHAAALITDKVAFAEAKEKLSGYLQKLKQPYFNLDMWDVFNMNDTAHAEQAAYYLSVIAHNNLIFSEALEKDDPAILQQSTFLDLSPAFKTFKDLLNYESYKYGWVHIWQLGSDDDETVDFFEENNKWGLKTEEGVVLMKPEFDESFAFDVNGLAIVVKEKKYGYINRQGKIVIPLVYDDAFDFGYAPAAVVKIDNGFGLINEAGKLILAAQYEDIKSLVSPFYTVRKNNKWGVITADSGTVVALEHEHRFEDGNDYYFTSVTGSTDKKVFNRQFQYIGSFPLQAVTHLGDNCYLVTEDSGVNESALYVKGGKKALSGFDEIVEQTNELLIIRKGKKYGVYGKKQKALLLPFEYDEITDMKTMTNSPAAEFVLVKKDDLLGVFNGIETSSAWVFPPAEYEEIKWLDSGYFACKKNGLWNIAESPSTINHDYQFTLVARRPPPYYFAYGFIGDDLFVIDQHELYIPTVDMIEEDIEENYDYYFDKPVEKLLKSWIKRQKNNPEVRSEDENSSEATIIFNKGVEAFDNGDYEKAIYYYKAGTERGHAGSMNNLAYCYIFTEAVKDYNSGAYWYRKAVDAGDTDALSGLAACYKEGLGVEPDVSKAFDLYSQAAEKNDPYGYMGIGSLYGNSIFGMQDIDKAIVNYKKAEAAGISDHEWLGYLYHLKNDEVQALYHFRIGHDEGNGFCSCYIGLYLKDGIGIAKNIKEAIRYFEEAINRGQNGAHIELARIYQDEKAFSDRTKKQEHLQAAKMLGIDIPEDIKL